MSDTETVPIWQFREETGKLCDKIAELERKLSIMRAGWRAENAANLSILRTLEKDKYWYAYEILMQLCAVEDIQYERNPSAETQAVLSRRKELWDEAMDMYEDRK